jgi:hypothetical protein
MLITLLGEKMPLVVAIIVISWVVAAWPIVRSAFVGHRALQKLRHEFESEGKGRIVREGFFGGVIRKDLDPVPEDSAPIVAVKSKLAEMYDGSRNEVFRSIFIAVGGMVVAVAIMLFLALASGT